MDILYLVNDLAYFVNHRLPIAREQKRIGRSIGVGAPLPSSDREWEALATVKENDIDYFQFPVYRSWLSAKDVLTIIRGYRILRRQDPKILHLISYKSIVLGGIASQAASIEAVVSEVTGLGTVFNLEGYIGNIARVLYRAGLQVAMRKGDCRVVCQNSDDKAYITDTVGFERQRVKIISGVGVDVERFRPASKNRSHEESILQVALIGRMINTKGVRAFVEAARLAREESDLAPINWLLVGNVDEDNIESISATQLMDWSKEKNVEWRGYEEDIPRLMREEIDVVCLPSYREGLPKVLLEAMASGIPIVTTDVPGCRDLVESGRNGLLVRVGDAKQLYWAIKVLMYNPSLRKRLGRYGRKRAVAKYSRERAVNQYTNLYNTILYHE